MCPRKQRKAEVYSGGIQGIDGVFNINSEVLILIQVAGLADEALCEIRIDAPVSDLVGVSKSVERHLTLDSHVVEF